MKKEPQSRIVICFYKRGASEFAPWDFILRYTFMDVDQARAFVLERLQGHALNYPDFSIDDFKDRRNKLDAFNFRRWRALELYLGGNYALVAQREKLPAATQEPPLYYRPFRPPGGIRI